MDSHIRITYWILGIPTLPRVYDGVTGEGAQTRS